MSACIRHQQHQFAVILVPDEEPVWSDMTLSCLALLDEIFYTAGFIDPTVFDVVNSQVHARLRSPLQRYGGYASQQTDSLPYLVKHRSVFYGNCQLCHILFFL